jgi:hypothetical protein
VWWELVVVLHYRAVILVRLVSAELLLLLENCMEEGLAAPEMEIVNQLGLVRQAGPD